jgi:hypothetical protein
VLLRKNGSSFIEVVRHATSIRTVSDIHVLKILVSKYLFIAFASNTIDNHV